MVRLGFASVLPAGFLAACSLVNAPDDVLAPAGGQGGGTGNVGNEGGAGNGGATGGIGNEGGGGGGDGGAGPPVCGNAALQPGEVCDDGNTDDGDACNADCSAITEFDVAPAGHEWPGVGTSGVDGGKGFFVAYRQNDGTLAIKGRAYSGVGLPVGAEVPLSTAPGPDQSRIGTNGAGRSVVAWRSQSMPTEVHFRVVGPDGLPEGDDSVIPGSTANSLISVGSTATGQFALVWNGMNASGGLQAFSRALSDTGVPAGSTQPIGASGGGLPGVWGVAGGFVAAWTDGVGVLRGIRLTQAGVPLAGSDFPLSSEAASSSNNPFGAYVGPENQFISVFEKAVDIAGDIRTRVLRRRFNDLGMSAELDTVVSEVHQDEYHSRVARHSSGNFVVVWADGFDDCEIFARVFAPSGSPTGAPFKVNQVSAGCQSWPGVAVNEDGDAMFVWDSYDPGVGGFRIAAVIHPRLLVD